MQFKELFYEYPHRDSKYYSKELRETGYLRLWVIISSVCVGIVIAIWILMSGLLKLATYDCNVFEKNTGIETKYKNFACYANYKGDWVEKDNIILTIEGNK